MNYCHMVKKHREKINGVIHSDKFQPWSHCEIWMKLSTEITYQPSPETILLHCPTITEGEKVIDLLNC